MRLGVAEEVAFAPLPQADRDGEQVATFWVKAYSWYALPTDVRAKLAQSLIDACVETFQLDALSVKVEFTQHDGDGMYHPQLGGFNTNWHGDERPA